MSTGYAKKIGTFTGTGQSGSVAIRGLANLLISGTFVGMVKLQKSFDGSSWHVVSRDSVGNEAAYTAPAALTFEEPEDGVLYRLDCTAYTSGTISYRISQ